MIVASDTVPSSWIKYSTVGAPSLLSRESSAGSSDCKEGHRFEVSELSLINALLVQVDFGLPAKPNPHCLLLLFLQP
jgi:hypothetical protein